MSLEFGSSAPSSKEKRARVFPTDERENKKPHYKREQNRLQETLKDYGVEYENNRIHENKTKDEIYDEYYNKMYKEIIPSEYSTDNNYHYIDNRHRIMTLLDVPTFGMMQCY